MSEWTNYEWDGISARIYDTWYARVLSWHTRTNEKNIFFLFFELMLVRYLPGLGISEIRYSFFRGLIWIRLRNSGSFFVGQVPGTSHVATRPKKHTCERRTCPSLPPPFPAGPASSLFVVVQGVLDVIRIPATTVRRSSFSSFPSLFFFLSADSFKENNRYSSKNICCCLMYFYY